MESIIFKHLTPRSLTASLPLKSDRAPIGKANVFQPSFSSGKAVKLWAFCMQI